MRERRVRASGPRRRLVSIFGVAVAAALALTLFEGTAAAAFHVTALTAPGGNPGDRFGYSVALEANFAVVGAPGANNGQGAVYLFSNTSGSWTWQQTLTAPNPPSNLLSFGISVSIWKTGIAVGSLTQQPQVGIENGAVYLFTLAPASTTWVPQQTLTAGDFNDTTVNAFGASVSIGLNVLVVGAPFLGGEAISGKGAAFTYQWSGTQWMPGAKLTPPSNESTSGDHFGASVAIYTGPPLVGAPGATGGGRVYLMPVLGGAPLAEAASPAMGSADLLGQSVAMGRAEAAVGAPGSRSAYGFVISSTSMSLVAFPSGGDPNFGASVAQSFFSVVGSDPLPGTGTAPGAAYSFPGIGVSTSTPLVSPMSAAGDHFGFSMALVRATGVGNILVGAYGQNNSQGAAFVFAPVTTPVPALGRGGALALAAALAGLGAFFLRLRRWAARA
jgi:hypothetical protein